MEHLCAPWRDKYIEGEKPEKCILCELPAQNNDQATYIVHRGALNYVVLNSFPYNPGHLLVAPYRHIARLEEMTPEERHEHFDIVSQAAAVLRDVFKPGGFNFGINTGRIAGAGIDDHVHTHIVPRWSGDTNFVTVLGDVRVVPQALAATYEKLRGKFSPA